MDSFLLMIFQYEVSFQCKTILKAVTEINQALTRRDWETGDDVWMSIQGLLIAAANISRMFWPTKAQDRSALRESLGVQDDSPLRNRDLRNGFEHFDERLEDWYEDGRNYIGRNIGPASAIVIEGEEPNTRFQHFDPQTGELTFLDKSLDLLALIREAEMLYQRAEQAVIRRPDH